MMKLAGVLVHRKGLVFSFRYCQEERGLSNAGVCLWAKVRI